MASGPGKDKTLARRRPAVLPALALLALAATGPWIACGSRGGEPSAGTPAVISPHVSTALTPVPTAAPASPLVSASITPAPSAVPLPPATPEPEPAASPPAVTVRKGTTQRKAVALTFDAGSDAGYAADILDTLAANGITAAFGVTGKWVEQNPGLLQRIVKEGHVLINHTYDHASFTGASTGKPPLGKAERWDELDRTEALVQELAGATTKPYFRPPFGDYDDSVNADVGARGYAYNVMWTVDSFGWKGITAEEIRARCLDLAEPGTIYIFHVGSASQDGPALQGIIDGLRAAGYEIVPLPDLLPG